MLTVELVGKQVKVSTDMAIFITMNPTYAGRSNLPDNLKKLFRSLAMTKPDRQLIAEVMLFSQGFRTAEKLASKIVPFFKWVLFLKALIVSLTCIESCLCSFLYLVLIPQTQKYDAHIIWMENHRKTWSYVVSTLENILFKAALS